MRRRRARPPPTPPSDPTRIPRTLHRTPPPLQSRRPHGTPPAKRRATGAARKIKDTKNAADATADAAQQLQRLMPKRFLATTPWPRLQHFSRYLKAIVLRLDKLRADPARDAARMAEIKREEQRYWRLVA